MAAPSETGPGRRDDVLTQVADIARQMAESADLDELLQRIVDLGEAYLEGCDGVSMMLIRRGGELMSPAYSSEVAYESDLAQYRNDEGPCLEALREHETIVIDDLRTEQRWPNYRAEALALGVRSMISFRLFVHADTMGALDFYSRTPHAFDDHSRALGQVFASHAAVAMKSAIAEVGLHAALRTRDLIGQAKGILMARESLDAAAAFVRLREVSQARNLALRDLAEEVTRTGQLPDG
ncbi:MAG: GAF and ANTAR domain-containing protein [Ilumatobacteraceae bacterium]